MSFATRLRLLMEERGWSQTDLSQKAGIPQTTLSAMLRGVEPKLANATSIAVALGVDLDWLAGRVDESAEGTNPRQVAAFKIVDAIERHGAEKVAAELKGLIESPPEASERSNEPPKESRKSRRKSQPKDS